MPAQEFHSFFDPAFQRSGCADVLSPLGNPALSFDNSGKDFACDYLQSNLTLPQGNFSVQFYLRTYAGGCNGVCLPEATLPRSERPINPAARSLQQSWHGGAVLSNCPCRIYSTGFSIQVNQPSAYLTVNFQTEEMEEPIQLRGMREACDDRWHLVCVTVARDGLMNVYCDGKLLKSADISAYNGQSLGEGTLSVGCDAMKLYGLGKVDLGEMTLRHTAFSAEEVEASYQKQAVRTLALEIVNRKLNESPLFDQEAVSQLLEKAHAALESADDPVLVYHELALSYEETLLKTIEPDAKLLVVADTHCAEEDNGRTVAFRNALKWAQDLGVDAMLHGGDYSQYGRECDFEGFWDSMRLYWNDKPFFLTVGNHETLHNDAKTLAKRQCDWLREFGMVGEDHETMYYEGEFKGHHVLVLAQYYDYEITGYKRMWQFAGHVKREQLDWVREKLDAYCGQGKPVFLVIHNAHGPLLNIQTQGNCTHDSVILRGDELYDILRDRKDVIFCTGHVHHGLGAISGLFPIEGYHVLDIPGFKNGAYGYGFDEATLPAGTAHTGFFAYIFGRTILLRAADFANHNWLPSYDQIVTLP